MSWKINKVSNYKSSSPILIEGLPGVGNVGKIVVEYLIETLDAKKVYELISDEMPHYVFVNEESIVELPKIEIYAAKIKGKSIFLLSGDIQPINETSCYSFCNKVLDTFQKNKGKEIITLGGIALNEEPKNPKVYFTANSKKTLEKYSAKNKELSGFIGPIVGVTGVLNGLAAKKKINAVTLLAETARSPNHIGFKGARKILKVLNNNLDLNIDILDLEKEFKDIKPTRVYPSKKSIKQQKKKDEDVLEENFNYIG